MCGRFNVHDLSGALLWLFGMSEGPEQPARYNITPSPVTVLHWGIELILESLKLGEGVFCGNYGRLLYFELV